MQNYAISLYLDPDTVYALQKQLASLSVLQAVQINGAAVPVICSVQHPVQTIMSVLCNAKFQGLLFPPGRPLQGSLTADFSTGLTLGQTLHVQDGGTQVTSDGAAGGISIVNETSAQITAGIAQVINDSFVTTTAFYVAPGATSVYTPVAKVFLTIGPGIGNVGTVAQRISNAGYLVDLTSDSAQGVSYNVNTGWSDPNGVASQVDADVDLVALLVEPAPATVV